MRIEGKRIKGYEEEMQHEMPVFSQVSWCRWRNKLYLWYKWRQWWWIPWEDDILVVLFIWGGLCAHTAFWFISKKKLKKENKVFVTWIILVDVVYIKWSELKIIFKKGDIYMKKIGKKLLRFLGETTMLTPSCVIPNTLGNIEK
jgi:hypothetical protein